MTRQDKETALNQIVIKQALEAAHAKTGRVSNLPRNTGE